MYLNELYVHMNYMLYVCNSTHSRWVQILYTLTHNLVITYFLYRAFNNSRPFFSHMYKYLSSLIVHFWRVIVFWKAERALFWTDVLHF
jgi:hypothetical protein